MDNTKINFAKCIFDIRKSYGLTKKQFAKILSVSDVTVGYWERGERTPKAGKLEEIARKLNVRIEQLVFTDENYVASQKENEIVYVPLLGSVSCGFGILADENILAYEPMPFSWTKGGNHFCLIAKGDSMIGDRIFEDDLLLIKQQSIVDSGDIAVVTIDGQSFLKRAYMSGDSLILHSANPKYEPIVINGDEYGSIRILGKLTKVIKNF